MDRLAGCLPDNSLSPGDRKVNLRPQLHPSPPRFLLGVDAGGTRCRARLSDHEGRRLGEGQSGPANAFTDPDGSWASIWAASAAAYSQAGLEPAQVAAYTTACLGVAGLAPIEPSAPRTWPLNIFGASIVDTDAFVALMDMIICRLAKEGVDQLSLLGGLSASIAPWLNAETMKFVSPKGDPLDGAILIAMQGPI